MKQMINNRLLPGDSAEFIRLRFEAAKRAAMNNVHVVAVRSTRNAV